MWLMWSEGQLRIEHLYSRVCITGDDNITGCTCYLSLVCNTNEEFCEGQRNKYGLVSHVNSGDTDYECQGRSERSILCQEIGQELLVILLLIFKKLTSVVGFLEFAMCLAV
ncbi:hypothetical protein M8J76_004035 [Diaphorina citri]|nr:hypothetical protein M8J75_012948 [Diaphorina citri]KAI5723302.1 hypothetical protein M8J76_004035 [Diaphorina citri]KAI5728700.1 hypothetical protein M8J77_019810 [Diaphorina citri]